MAITQLTQAVIRAVPRGEKGATGAPGGNTYDTLQSAALEVIPVELNVIHISGYYEPGDGGSAIYARVADEPNHAGKFQSLDGAWWEICENEVNLKQFGGYTSTALVTALSTGKCLKLGLDKDNVQLNNEDVPKVLSLLNLMSIVSEKFTLHIPAGEYSFNDELRLVALSGGDRLVLEGAEIIKSDIIVNTIPTIQTVPLSVQGQSGRFIYDVTLQIADSSLFSVGDWVGVDIKGIPVNISLRNYLLPGLRAWELSGAFEVVATLGNSITVRNYSRIDQANFPSGNSITVSSGEIAKYPTVLKFSGAGGNAAAGGMQLNRLAFIGSGAYSSVELQNGLNIEGAGNCSLSASELLISGFSGSGVRVFGSGATFKGDNLYISNTANHSVSVYNQAQALCTQAVVSGSDGAGFIASQGGRISAPGSRAFHVKHAGFLANRTGQINCRDSYSCGNGNYTNYVANGNDVNTEGKGFEAETSSRMEATNCVALFNLFYGFYNNSGSTMSAGSAIAAGQIWENGHCFIQRGVGTLYADYGVALGRGVGYGSNRGFYCVGGHIGAQYSWASNCQYDYAVQAGGHIIVNNRLNASATYNPPVNVVSLSNAIISNSMSFDTTVALQGARFSRVDLSILNDTVTISRNYHTVDTERGEPADDLITIDGGQDGTLLIIKCMSITRAVTVKHAIGNIRLQGGQDRLLNNPRDMLMLLYQLQTNAWVEIAYSSNH